MLDVQSGPTAVASRPDRWRPAFILAGSAAIASIALVFAAAGTAGGDPVAMATSGLGIASSLTALAAHRHGHRPGRAAGAGAHTVPGLRPGRVGGRDDRHDPDRRRVLVERVRPARPGTQLPDVVRGGLASVTAGFVVSYLLMGLGWVLTGIALLRAELLGVSGWVLILAALSPLPFRYLPLAVAVAVGVACGLRIGRRTGR